MNNAVNEFFLQDGAGLGLSSGSHCRLGTWWRTENVCRIVPFKSAER